MLGIPFPFCVFSVILYFLLRYTTLSTANLHIPSHKSSQCSSPQKKW